MAESPNAVRKPVHEVLIDRLESNWRTVSSFGENDTGYHQFLRDLDILNTVDISADHLPDVIGAVWKIHVQTRDSSGARGIAVMLAVGVSHSLQSLLDYQTECHDKGLISTEAMFVPPL